MAMALRLTLPLFEWAYSPWTGPGFDLGWVTAQKGGLLLGPGPGEVREAACWILDSQEEGPDQGEAVEWLVWYSALPTPEGLDLLPALES